MKYTYDLGVQVEIQQLYFFKMKKKRNKWKQFWQRILLLKKYDENMGRRVICTIKPAHQRIIL